MRRGNGRYRGDAPKPTGFLQHRQSAALLGERGHGISSAANLLREQRHACGLCRAGVSLYPAGQHRRFSIRNWTPTRPMIVCEPCLDLEDQKLARRVGASEPSTPSQRTRTVQVGASSRTSDPRPPGASPARGPSIAQQPRPRVEADMARGLAGSARITLP